MAKDVVAFANACGGTLLIGSVEKDGFVAKHLGIDRAEAVSTRRDIEEAVRDLVRPRPVIDFPGPCKVEGSDRVVLVVEVQPYPGQAVGVHAGRKDEDPWSFPVRVGTQTAWYSPEQLVLLMDVAYRRKIQLLHAARRCGVVQIEHRLHPGRFEVRMTNEPAQVGEAVIVEVNDIENVARIESKGAHFWLPVDVIERIWRNGERWALQLQGELLYYASTENDGPTMRYFRRD